jgi:hypothetical protein
MSITLSVGAATSAPVGADLLLSLPDIAELAGVQRPVASVWRRRYARGSTPFPEPVGEVAGSPRFKAQEVADWIERVGVGKNSAFRADLAVRSALSHAADDVDTAREIGSFTALLALAAHAPESLAEMDTEEILDLADEVDPDDSFLYAEVEGLGPELGRVAQLADAVASAAYTPGGAVEALLAGRFRLRAHELTRSALHPAALDLAADVVSALLPDDGSVTLADPYPGCGDLVAAVLGRAERLEEPMVQVPPASVRPARLARRRLAAHGRHVQSMPADGEAVGLDSDAHVVMQLPATGEEGISDSEVLARLDDIALRLAPGRVAVLLGPASAMVDGLRDHAADVARDAIFRTGRVRSVVLLPPGMVTERPRQRVALWVLGDGRPAVSLGEQWTAVADLSEHRPGRSGFASALVEDLITDIVAAQGTVRRVTSHAFRFARFVRTSQALATSESLVAVARPVQSVVREDGVTVAARLRELAADVGAVPASSPLALGIDPVGSGESTAHRMPVGKLIERKALRRIPGNRVAPDDVTTQGPDGEVGGSTRVIGTPELTGAAPWGRRRMDRLRFAAAYPAGRYTEPGDVIFCGTPRPAAVVDTEGFSVVEYPAQVLRGAGRQVRGPSGRDLTVVPQVLATDIGAQGPAAARWRAWEVRLVPRDQGDALVGALEGVGRRAAALRAEATRLDDLARALTDGVAAGVIGIRQDEAPSSAELVETT